MAPSAERKTRWRTLLLLISHEPQAQAQESISHLAPLTCMDLTGTREDPATPEKEAAKEEDLRV